MATDLSVLGSKLHPQVKDRSTNPVIKNDFIPGSLKYMSLLLDPSANIEKKKPYIYFFLYVPKNRLLARVRSGVLFRE